MNRICLEPDLLPELPMTEDCSVLNTPYTVDGRTLHNRIVFQPMEGADGTADGSPGELTRRRYLRFASGGAAVIWMEAVAVCPEGRANPHQLWLHRGNAAAFRSLADEIRQTARQKYGWEPLIILQATHSGRQSRPVDVPAPICACVNGYLEERRPMPESCVISDAACDALPDRYADTARLAAECGLDGIDVKCCHGYLLSEFLSARNRTGRYGGSLENRTRLYFACLEAAKHVCDQTGLLLTTRLGLYEGFPYPWGFGVSEKGGLDFDGTEPAWLLGQLRDRFGIGLINLTIGNPYVNPHVNRPYRGFAEEGVQTGVARIAAITGTVQRAFPELSFILSGPSALGEKSPNYCAAMIQNGSARLAGFGRMTFAYPDFWNDLRAHGTIDRKKCCITCAKCTQIMRTGGPAGCPIRDSACYLPVYNQFVKGDASI
ncbi:MAG: flavin oxidoreductase/NADH oxidase [Clostridia bacterium]